MNRIRAYFAETTSELLTKVSWPTWNELQSSAVVVMIASVIIAIVVFTMDSIFNKLMEVFYQMF